MKNKQLDVKLIRLEQSPEADSFIEIGESTKVSYSDLITQLAKVAKGTEGVGDLEEQMIRMDIIKKAKSIDTGKAFNFSKEEIKLMKVLLKFFIFKIVHDDLILFQEEIKKLEENADKS